MKQESAFKKIPLEKIHPNPQQPRKEFAHSELIELADSIVEHGVIKPIAVEETADGEYILHDGERRLRAAQMAGLLEIPAMVHPPLNGTGPQERLTRALVANIQTETMSPVDEALAIARLHDEFKLTPQQIAKRLSKKVVTIYKALQLADLQPEILQLMREKRMTTENKVVRALLSILNIKDRVQLAAELAQRKSAAATIVAACKNFNALKPVVARRKSKKGAAYKTFAHEGLDEIKDHLPEWNALYQLGKVPPFPVLNDVVMETCDSCSLRTIASPSVCGPCALGVALQGLMKAVSHA